MVLGHIFYFPISKKCDIYFEPHCTVAECQVDLTTHWSIIIVKKELILVFFLFFRHTVDHSQFKCNLKGVKEHASTTQVFLAAPILQIMMDTYIQANSSLAWILFTKIPSGQKLDHFLILQRRT